MTDSPSPVPSSPERAEQFTPGPWHVEFECDGPLVGTMVQAECWVTDADGNPIWDETGACPSEANARLIAAAPALYEALKGLVDDDDAGVSLADQRSRHEARMAAAKAAILKANGSEQ